MRSLHPTTPAPVALPTPGRATAPTIGGRPLGWDGLALAVTVARAHPDWTADQVERVTYSLTDNSARYCGALCRKLLTSNRVGGAYYDCRTR